MTTDPGATDQREVSAGTEPAFANLTERHRRELHVHCYRMLASFEEAEDSVQETFLRAWRAWDSFEEGAPARAWLYRIATNVCLDVLRRRSRRGIASSSFAEVPWLQPYPDQLLDEVATDAELPDVQVVDRETSSCPSWSRCRPFRHARGQP